MIPARFPNLLPSRGMTAFLYFHGFASSPDSKKAGIFRKDFKNRNLSLTVPDLEAGGFENMTLSGQIELIQKCMDALPEKRFGLIGSSMGGYLAALVAQLRPEVRGIYLMAPGFDFLRRWRHSLHFDLNQPGEIPPLIKVFHYRYNTEKVLNTFIFEDAGKWERLVLNRILPTRIVHGVNDESIPIEESRRFVLDRPWCRLAEVDSDHGLLSHIEWIVEDCLEFFREEKLVI